MLNGVVGTAGKSRDHFDSNVGDSRAQFVAATVKEGVLANAMQHGTNRTMMRRIGGRYPVVRN